MTLAASILSDWSIIAAPTMINLRRLISFYQASAGLWTKLITLLTSSEKASAEVD